MKFTEVPQLGSDNGPAYDHVPGTTEAWKSGLLSNLKTKAQERVCPFVLADAPLWP